MSGILLRCEREDVNVKKPVNQPESRNGASHVRYTRSSVCRSGDTRKHEKRFMFLERRHDEVSNKLRAMPQVWLNKKGGRTCAHRAVE